MRVRVLSYLSVIISLAVTAPAVAKTYTFRITPKTSTGDNTLPLTPFLYTMQMYNGSSGSFSTYYDTPDQYGYYRGYGEASFNADMILPLSAAAVNIATYIRPVYQSAFLSTKVWKGFNEGGDSPQTISRYDYHVGELVSASWFSWNLDPDSGRYVETTLSEYFLFSKDIFSSGPQQGFTPWTYSEFDALLAQPGSWRAGGSRFESTENGIIQEEMSYSGDVQLVAIDGVALAVPEPKAWAFMGGGLLLLGWAARRRRFDHPLGPLRRQGHRLLPGSPSDRSARQMRRQRLAGPSSRP